MSMFSHDIYLRANSFIWTALRAAQIFYVWWNDDVMIPDKPSLEFFNFFSLQLIIAKLQLPPIMVNPITSYVISDVLL